MKKDINVDGIIEVSKLCADAAVARAAVKAVTHGSNDDEPIEIDSKVEKDEETSTSVREVPAFPSGYSQN